LLKTSCEDWSLTSSLNTIDDVHCVLLVELSQECFIISSLTLIVKGIKIHAFLVFWRLSCIIFKLLGSIIQIFICFRKTDLTVDLFGLLFDGLFVLSFLVFYFGEKSFLEVFLSIVCTHEKLILIKIIKK